MQQGLLSQYVNEWGDEFLQLWPHRWDYLWAKHPRPGESPNWQTESRHPVSDRMLLAGKSLYGVRFGPKTEYVVFDIDRQSPYHPLRDPLAVRRLANALEQLGLVEYIPLTSSYSGGIHLYFPFIDARPSWQLAAAIAQLLTQKGFLLEPGILEAFPNVRAYDPEGHTLFNGHRLPLQQGSYLLSKSWDLVWGDADTFATRWKHAQMRNDVDTKQIERLAAAHTRVQRSLTYKAAKFLDDLNSCIETGWTGDGQTNYLMGRISLRAYVFGHVMLRRSEPLTGEELVMAIVADAVKLPGYAEHCGHQTDIWQRAQEWARCVESCPRYYPFHFGKGKQAGDTAAAPAPALTWNEFQQKRAREKICFAIADQLNKGTLPATTLERFLLLTQQYGLGGATLYAHRDLWHPDHLWKTPPHPPDPLDVAKWGAVGAPHLAKAQKLIGSDGRNEPASKASSPFWEGWDLDTGRNPAPVAGLGDFSEETCGKPDPRSRPG